jgi:hypothetical protein
MMVDREVLALDITHSEREKIEELAHLHGFDSVQAYLLALVKADNEQFDFDTPSGLLNGLRESLRQAITGDTRPVSELWDALEDE